MKNLLRAPLLFALVSIATTSFAQTFFLVEAPSNLAGNYDFTDSFSADGWGANLDTTTVFAEAVIARDNGMYMENGQTGADSASCGPTVNAAEVAGKVAFVYRGTCNFSRKAYEVQQAGAVGCVIINNQSGPLVNMLGGDFADEVTIPTIFVSDVTGAQLADSINAGSVEVFIGNITGLYDYNVGTYPENVSRAKSFAIPTPLVQNGGELIRPSGWIFNYGAEDATGVRFNAVISQDGNEVYNDTSVAATIPANGDSLYFLLPDFRTYEPGFYTVEYNVLSDSTDAYPNDNSVTSEFWINDQGLYSKSRIDPVEGPITNGFVQTGADPFPADGWLWCNALEVDSARGMSFSGMQFAATANDGDTTVSLDGKSVFINLFKVTDYEPGVSLNLEALVDNEIYDYFEDLQEEFITVPFPEPIPLEDNSRYWTCIFSDDEELFFGFDSDVDYGFNFDSVYVSEPVSPVNSDGWATFGFTNGVASIVTILRDPNSIAEQAEKMEVTPYPNPTVDVINIPLGGLIIGDVSVDVYDIAGSLVLSETICQKSNNLRMDVSGLSAGLHSFNLTFEDKSSTSFKVVITK